MKQHLRKQIREKLAAMSDQTAAEKSHAACKSLVGLAEFHEAKNIMLYMPIPNEVDCLPAALAAWQRDKRVLVPRVNFEQRHMLAVECKTMDDDMVINRGIREPSDGEPWPIEDIDMIVVPAMAFDRSGNRLGRGGGFYDRFLAEPDNHAILCGLAFDEQVVDEIFTEQHDHPVGLLVTDKDVINFLA